MYVCVQLGSLLTLCQILRRKTPEKMSNFFRLCLLILPSDQRRHSPKHNNSIILLLPAPPPIIFKDGGVDEILRRELDGLRVEAAARARSEAVLREEVRRLKRRSVKMANSEEAKKKVTIMVPTGRLYKPLPLCSALALSALLGPNLV